MSVENVYVVGDVVEMKYLIMGRCVWMFFVLVGNKMGYVVGSNIVGKEIYFLGVFGISIIKFFDFEIGKIGFIEVEVMKEGYDVRMVFIKVGMRFYYYFGLKIIWFKGVVDNEINRFFGV